MFKEQSVLLILSLCCGLSLSVDICEHQLNGVHLSHPADCNKFVECRNGKTDRIMSCPVGQHFNRFTGASDSKQRAACDMAFVYFASEDASRSACCALYGCNSYPDIFESLAFPGNSNSPLAPSNAAAVDIPSPETPDTPAILLKKIDRLSVYGSRCFNNLNVCVSKPDGSVSRLNGTCNHYVICVAECATILSCPANFQYNIDERKCDYPRNVKCPWESRTEITGPSGVTCANRGICAGRKDGKMFASSDGNGYIVCQCECEIQRPCPDGTKFNEQLLTCAHEGGNGNGSGNGGGGGENGNGSGNGSGNGNGNGSGNGNESGNGGGNGSGTGNGNGGGNGGGNGCGCGNGCVCCCGNGCGSGNGNGTESGGGSGSGGGNGNGTESGGGSGSEGGNGNGTESGGGSGSGGGNGNGTESGGGSGSGGGGGNGTESGGGSGSGGGNGNGTESGGGGGSGGGNGNGTESGSGSGNGGGNGNGTESGGGSGSGGGNGNGTESGGGSGSGGGNGNGTESGGGNGGGSGNGNNNSTNNICGNDIQVCKNQTNAALLPVDGVCNKFYQCNHGCAVEIQCPSNTVFNPNKNMCDYPENYKCPWPHSPPSGPSAGPSGIACPSGGRCTGQANGTFFPSLTSCSKYVQCQCECEIELSCPNSLYWDSKLLTCNQPANVKCQLNQK